MKIPENYPDYLFEEAERRERVLQDATDLENKQSKKYLITYYYKNDLEQRHQRHHSMQMAIAVAGMLIATGDYVIDSITTEY